MKKKTSLVLKKVEAKLKQKEYSESTLNCYLDWIYRFLFYYETEKGPVFGKKEIVRFVEFLNKECNMAPATISQAQNAVLFLYKDVWQIPVDTYSLKIKHTKQKPVILNRKEISRILSLLNGDKWLIASMMYGCGLTALECTQLRIKNIDFAGSIIHVENEHCSRQTLLPKALHLPLENQIEKIKTLYNENILLDNYAGVLVSNLKNNDDSDKSKEFEYHFLFPSSNLHHVKQSGLLLQYAVSDSYIQKAIKNVPVTKSLHKKICCSSFRHSFATHLIEEGYDIHMVQELLGHKNLQSTIVYKNLANPDIKKIISPLDKLLIY